MPSHPTSIWRRSPNKLRQNELWLECFYLVTLFFAALALFLVNLGKLPLLDWNEGIVAQVAKEIYQGSGALENWIFPSLWGEPYLDQPPLLHGLIAIAYKLGGISEFTTRFPGAFLGAISVLLLYGIGREIFVARFPALCSALVYLTCLPIVRLSRLAMSDGPLLCFELLTVWAILRSRRDLKWSVIAGLGLGLMGLVKGIAALQIFLVLGLFLAWDTPRMLGSPYFLTGLCLGVLPSLGWYIIQWFHFPELSRVNSWLRLVTVNLSSSNFARLQLTPKYYLIRVIEYVFPWIIVILGGIKWASRNLHWGWAKLIVTWTGAYLVFTLLIFNGDYWSFLPLYPGLALAAGKQLDWVRNLPSYINYPQVWAYGFALMAVAAAFAGLHWGIRDYVDFYLPFIFGFLTVTFAATSIAIAGQEKQFIPLLFWGLFVTIFLLMISPHWIWELKTVEPVKPIAELIRQYIPEQQIVYTSMSQKRPSLEFYSGHQVIFQEPKELKTYWESGGDIFLLLDSGTVKRLNIPPEMIFSDSEQEPLPWVLAIKKS